MGHRKLFLMVVLLSGCGEAGGASPKSTDGTGSQGSGGAVDGATGTGSMPATGGTTGNSEEVAPVLSGGKYLFSYSDVVFEVDVEHGARILTFKKGSVNVLDDGDGKLNFGSTFWPSPQSAWGWPPPAAIDSEPYEAEVEGGVLTATSATDEKTGLRVTKRFQVNQDQDRVEIRYSMTNATDTDVSFAPWEVSRVAGGANSFFSASVAPRLVDDFPDPWDASLERSFFHEAASGLESPAKLFQDGAGWLGHTMGSLFFLKTWGDILPTEAAPEEAEIEIYSDPVLDYVELENQGAYGVIQPGATVHYEVNWYLRELPSKVDGTTANQDLFSFAEDLAQQK